MSIDKLMRDMVRDEVARAMAPVTAAIEELQAQGAIIARLGAVLGAPVKRGPGRPPKVAVAPKVAGAARSKSTKGSKGKSDSTGTAGEVRLCALEGCKRRTRSKGYCAAHYQKYRLLAKTNRLPPDWVEDAPPGSVKNVVLPRGRAGAKALAELKKK